MFHSHSSASLSIHVTSANNLVSIQHLGAQDPYFQFSLDFNQKDAYLKTFTHKNAGENAVWNQTFTVSLNGEPDLFVEIMNDETTVDEVIGFAAIPINQIVHAEGANMNGIFEVYNLKGEPAGTVNLQLAALGFPNSQPADFSREPVRGYSYVHEAHAVRMKSIKKKATGVAVGGALLGGALAIGAGLLGKKLYDDHQEQEEEERREEEERARQEQEEEERRNRQREEFEAERARFEAEKQEYERNREQEEREQEREQEEEEHHHHRRRSYSDDDECDADRWDPVGTYAAGDRVRYHGQVYVCLQGHTSNPTWTPDAAHSLWQNE